VTGLAAGAATDAQLLAAAYLNRVAEPASVPLWVFVQQHGYLDAAAAIRSGDVPPEVASCTEARRDTTDPHADLAAAERNDIRLLTPDSPDWPHLALAPMHHLARRRVAGWRAGLRTRPPRGELIPPLALWVRGPAGLAAVGLNSVAVVGSRAATSYGERLASEFGYGLARQDVVVVSGGAYGIDAAAHRGALAADGVTLLVSAGGLDRPYPAGNANLYQRTADSGLLISERPPGSAPHRQRFLSRNRLIAAFGAATLVVEAGARSGALNSAVYARDVGRPVLAVPGPVTSALSVGCHRLLQRLTDPAALVTSVAEVLPFCSTGATTDGTAGAGTGDGMAGPRTGAEGGAGHPQDGLNESARSVLDGFPGRGWATPAELSRLSGRPVPEVCSALADLVTLGFVAHSERGYRLAGACAPT
jgi:DNA processing protein